jgi:hypothetical protein
MCPGSQASHTVNTDVGGMDSCSNIIIIEGYTIYFFSPFLCAEKGGGFVDLCQHCMFLFNVDKVMNFYETKLNLTILDFIPKRITFAYVQLQTAAVEQCELLR